MLERYQAYARVAEENPFSTQLIFPLIEQWTALFFTLGGRAAWEFLRLVYSTLFLPGNNFKYQFFTSLLFLIYVFMLNARFSLGYRGRRRT